MMLAVTQTDLRTNIKQLLDNVAHNDDTIVVTRSNRENVVIISEAEYNSWQETNFLMKNENNRKSLSESLASINRGEGKVLTPEEWEKMNG
ncbi:type II toxin-antitoxin system Phd/YefM family antitoxin [Leuconostoc holzapfelii]|uniref:Antitoxin n=1 Tax=Leuconostoc holzapfelii TaxID=434464 RepID=A0ABT2NWJ3_9LACO|nr:type II toxin-antitoxin system Phd/YefM family antitoxin [Leuconostoc holzapfelii]MCT8389741.1 type II toxin-antitoxin system Phd/YefM family antitoxin [Leuconostoc holzapfelii]